jgi:hypothetical protein
MVPLSSSEVSAAALACPLGGHGKTVADIGWTRTAAMGGSRVVAKRAIERSRAAPAVA